MSTTTPRLYLGDYRTVFARLPRGTEAVVDVLLSDVPFADRVHAGQRTGSSVDAPTVAYQPVDVGWCFEFADFWSARVKHWALIMSDHDSQRWHEAAWLARGWYVFTSIPCLRKGPPPRYQGDGPTTAADRLTVIAREAPADEGEHVDEESQLLVCRPRRRLPRTRNGSRRGSYGPFSQPRGVYPGCKSVELADAILADYTLPGDVIVDPCMGAGTFPLRAAARGCVAMGCDVNPDAVRKATERARGWALQPQ